ncbi:MAG: hypothetical protein ACREUU_13475, partial [Gammaproteobacteria bacterium]
LKVSHVQHIHGGGGVVFATGTPIANSVAEMFTMQRYLQMTALRALPVDHFDSWAATFGEPVTAMELAPDGSGYRLHTRFARFINVPGLMQPFRQAADIQTQTMLKLPVPDLRGGRPTIINAPRSSELKEIVDSLVERAEALRTGRIDPREAHMLLVTTDGRKAALDLRLYDPSLPDHADSKVNHAVGQVERIWRETVSDRLTQLVFCGLSTPTGGKGFSVYEDMRDKLAARGVPADEMAFMHLTRRRGEDEGFRCHDVPQLSFFELGLGRTTADCTSMERWVEVHNCLFTQCRWPPFRQRSLWRHGRRSRRALLPQRELFQADHLCGRTQSKPRFFHPSPDRSG